MTNFSAKVLPALSLESVESITSRTIDRYIPLDEATSLDRGVAADITGIAVGISSLSRKMALYRDTYPMEVNVDLTVIENLEFCEAFFPTLLLLPPAELVSQLGLRLAKTLRALHKTLSEFHAKASAETSLSAIAGAMHVESVSLMLFMKGVLFLNTGRLPKKPTTFEQIMPFGELVKSLYNSNVLDAARDQYPTNSRLKMLREALHSLCLSSDSLTVMWTDQHDQMVKYENIHSFPLSTIKHSMETMFSGTLSCAENIHQFAENYSNLVKTLQTALEPADASIPNPQTETIEMPSNNNTSTNGDKTSREQSFDPNDTVTDADFVEAETVTEEISEKDGICQKTMNFFRRQKPTRQTLVWTATAVAATAAVAGGIVWYRQKKEEQSAPSA